ncbi:MAG: heparinase II/III family protein, partial [Oscillospiraceae bacterium]|nr:heparinase II/III family protein [Oscillospiraceae bacterium]
MRKRLISIALLVALLLSLLPAGLLPTVQAAPSASSATVTSLFNARSKGVHPRIFANESDFARVRKLVQTDSYMKMWYARIYNFCLDTLEEPVLAYEIPDGKRLLSVCNNATKRITWLAMAYQISGEQRFAKRAVEEMLNVCSFKDWNPSHYLDTAQMSFGVGLGYDWLYHYMTSSQRSTIMNGIYKHGVSTQQTSRSCMTAIHNWNPWCNGGLSVAAAAIFENHPIECAAILSNAVSNIQKSMLFQPSGAYPEGPDYSTVGLGFTVYLIDTLDTVLGTDFGLSEIQGMKESGKFLIATNGYLYTFNYGDGSFALKDNAMMHWYANRYNMPELSLYQRENQTTNGRYDEFLSMIWYNPELVEGKSYDDRQLDYLMMSDEYESIASFRSFPGDAAQIFAAIKSGSNQTNHTDMDIGTFVMEAMGEAWFVEMGKDDYNLPNYMSRTNASSGRWTYYRKRAEGQNTIVINPNSYGGQDVDATCQITDYQSTYDGGYATVNMKNAYDGNGATSMKRSLALFDDRSRVRLRDEISCSSASTIYWFAHTQANISISSDGKTATLTQNGKTLLAQIASPDEAKFTKMNAKPLSTSPNPSGQNANEGYRKLVIKLTGTSKASITVFFTPILSESDKNKSLNTWGISNTGKMLKQYDPTATLTANAEGIYEIHDAEQLCLLSQMVADGNTFSGKTVKLMADIDMRSRSFQPIGGNDTSTAFKGTFDGNHHVVKNLLIFKPSGEGVGFFGRASGATIKNFGIDS